MPKGSEQFLALEQGYPVVGLFGADPAIHTRQDRSAEINETEFRSLLGALQKLVRSRISAHPTSAEQPQ